MNKILQYGAAIIAGVAVDVISGACGNKAIKERNLGNFKKAKKYDIISKSFFACAALIGLGFSIYIEATNIIEKFKEIREVWL